MSSRQTTNQRLLTAAMLILLLGLEAMLKFRKDSGQAEVQVPETKGTPIAVSQPIPDATQALATPTAPATLMPTSQSATSTIRALSTSTSTETVVGTPQTQSKPASSLTCGWSNVSNPVPGTLKGIAALSHNDIWAVGYTAGSPISTTATLTERWDGASWKLVPSPGVEGQSNHLNAIAALSENDVWAVGFSGDAYTERQRALILHWDGTLWKIVSAPETGQEASELSAIAAISNKETNTLEVWAVGGHRVCRSGSCTSQTLTMRWNGTAWAQAPSPDPSKTNNWLSGVAVVTSKDAWAVGSYEAQLPGERYPVGRPLIMHWDGRAWNYVPSPDTGAMYQSLYGVAALAKDDIWAVGGTNSDDTESSHSLYIHWDGKAWSRFPNNVDNAGNGMELVAVTALSPDNVWAVGGWLNKLISHWDGSAWTTFAGSTDIALSISGGLVATSHDGVWVTGITPIPNSGNAAIWRFDATPGACQE